MNKLNRFFFSYGIRQETGVFRRRWWYLFSCENDGRVKPTLCTRVWGWWRNGRGEEFIFFVSRITNASHVYTRPGRRRAHTERPFRAGRRIFLLVRKRSAMAKLTGAFHVGEFRFYLDRVPSSFSMSSAVPK